MLRTPTLSEAVLAGLKEEDYRGEVWAELKGALFAYAMPVIESWIASRQIFVKMSKNRPPIGFLPPTAEHHYPKRDEARSLTGETVVRAVDRVHKALKTEAWSPDGPAKLHTFLITTCLYQFSTVYRTWRKENEPLTYGGEEMKDIADMREDADVHHRVIASVPPSIC